jgi:uncharacterized membrane protein YbhN (UPF0104 family)
MSEITDEPASPKSMLTPRKIALQIIGWTIGIALLAWVIHGANQKGDWSRLRDADPWLLAALLGCTAVSSIINGCAFWITIQPLRNVGWHNMQWLNLVANMLNYAPIRLGAIARVMYNVRVDRLNLLQIGAWWAMITYVLFLGVGAWLLATLVRGRIDFIWALMIIAIMSLGGLTFWYFSDHPLLVKYGRGSHQLFENKKALIALIVLRILDLGAFCGRMAAALAILDLHVSPTQVVMLALVAFATDLIPVGKLGFREWCVSRVAATMTVAGGSESGMWDQLALIDSGGQALFFIPLGAIAMLWYRKRWRQSVKGSREGIEASRHQGIK